MEDEFHYDMSKILVKYNDLSIDSMKAYQIRTR